MSSHHFVKENQEPALLIWDAWAVDYDKIASLLEWVPLVLVHQDSVETVLSWGIKIDKIVCTEEYAANNLGLLEEHYPVVFVTFGQKVEVLDVVSHLVEVNQKAVNILGISPNEFPVHHEVFMLLDVVLFEKSRRHLLINKKPLKKWFMPQELLILPVDEEVFVEDIQAGKVQRVSSFTAVMVDEGFYRFESASAFWLIEAF